MLVTANKYMESVPKWYALSYNKKTAYAEP